MKKFALAGIAASILMLAPATAQTVPAASADGQFVIAQRGDGGGGGGRGGAMKGGGGGGGGPALRSGGGGGGKAMRGSSGSRSFDGARRSGGDGVGRTLRGGRNLNRGPRRADPGIKRGNRGAGSGYRRSKSYSRDLVRRRGHRYVWGPGLAFYYYGGYYYGDCDWLERRAMATGSAYWWNRYHQCIDW